MKEEEREALEAFIRAWEMSERLSHTRLLGDLKREYQESRDAVSVAIADRFGHTGSESAPLDSTQLGVPRPRSVLQQVKPRARERSVKPRVREMRERSDRAPLPQSREGTVGTTHCESDRRKLESGKAVVLWSEVLTI